MSTRAVIAEPRGDEWRGRYHHSDGYPSGLGRELWGKIAHYGPERVRKFLIHEHTGWSFILDADWLQTPGFVNYDRRYAHVDGEFKRLDFRPQCYCHGERAEKGWWITRRGNDGGTEWVYIIGKLAMTVETRDWQAKRWVTVAHLPYGGPEPDWQAIDNMADAKTDIAVG